MLASLVLPVGLYQKAGISLRPQLTQVFKTPVTLQAVCPVVTGVGHNATVFQLPSEVHMRPCDTVAKRPLPGTFYGSSKMFKTSASDPLIV